jgi:hypothetical protein
MSTTTSFYQKTPDFYSSYKECVDANKNKRVNPSINPRYSNFTHNIFHCGDEEQFSQYRGATSNDDCMKHCSLDSNMFRGRSHEEWSGYKNIQGTAVTNTFLYMFKKFKKGIFVKIADNEVKVFLPFSNHNFENEWADRIKVDPSKYKSINDFIRYISKLDGRNFDPARVNGYTNTWYANNCLVRYEWPISEGESNVQNMKNMFDELCCNRNVPDIEFFINRRDFPLLTKDGSEPYNHMWDSDHHPLVSHSFDKYVPILSMSKTDRFADVLIPTYNDWARVQSLDGKWLVDSGKPYNSSFDCKWAHKTPTAVFRGSSTGCGTTVKTNKRLGISLLSSVTPPDANGDPDLDAGITKWQLRPRKLQGNPYLQTIEIRELPFGLSSFMSYDDQSKYKYVVNVEGHVSAFRLSVELSMGSVVMIVDSEWKMWYSDIIEPYVHYIPVMGDLSDLIEKIKWCKDHDDECEQISKNAKVFYNTYLCKEGIFDYVQKTLVDLKKDIGFYLYNSVDALTLQIEDERSSLYDYIYPTISRSVNDINTIPYLDYERSYDLLKGVNWIVNMVLDTKVFEDVATRGTKVYITKGINSAGTIFKNKLGEIVEYNIAGFSFAVKSTKDKRKIREHIHEAYAGMNCINKIIKYIPNFVYVFGIYQKGDAYNVITERIRGKTLSDYIDSDDFNFRDFLMILIQLSLAINMAQNMCGFVHWDLTPWNIVLEIHDTPRTIDYIVDSDKVYRVTTTIVPVIIDFGKSHVINNNEHHGFINMYNTSTARDILTLLITSISKISLYKKLPHQEFSYLKKLANFMANSNYYSGTFRDSHSLKTFMVRMRKSSELFQNVGGSADKLTPLDLVNHILKFNYKFNVKVVSTYNNSMHKGNAKQVYEYILSASTTDRIKSYTNVFDCFTLPKSRNLLFVYHIIQELEENFSIVNVNMLSYLEKEGIDSSLYDDLFQNTLKKLNHGFNSLITNVKQITQKNKVDDFNNLVTASYTENTFLTPTKILKLLCCVNRSEDMSEYKRVIELVFLNDGTYRLSKTDKNTFIAKFNLTKILSTSSFFIKNNIANNVTLCSVARKIYKIDREVVSKMLESCTHAREEILAYVDIYDKILRIVCNKK